MYYSGNFLTHATHTGAQQIFIPFRWKCSNIFYEIVTNQAVALRFRVYDDSYRSKGGPKRIVIHCGMFGCQVQCSQQGGSRLHERLELGRRVSQTGIRADPGLD